MKKAFCAAMFAATMLAPISASAEWLQAKTRHFIIYTDDTRDNLKAYAEKLEKFDNGVRKLRGMRDDRVTDANKVTIYLVQGIGEINRLLGSGGGIAGWYDGRALGSVAFMPRSMDRDSGDKAQLTPDSVFFHEYSHHMQLQEVQAALPAWMVEGYAEFYASAAFTPEGNLIIGSPINYRADALYHDELPMDAMLTGSKDLDTNYQYFYGKAWLLTHYLAFNKAREGQLGKYVASLNKGVAPLTAAKDAFGDLNKLNSEIFNYMRGKMPRMEIAAANLSAGPVDIRPLTGGEVESMKIRHQTESGVNKKIADNVAANARTIAARYPADAAAQFAWAEAALDAKDFPTALAASNKALAINPKHLQALVVKGRALMGLAIKNGEKSRWAEARAAFTAASAIDPDAAGPQWKYYQSYQLEKVAPPPMAAQALYAAFVTVPQDDSLRLKVVRQLLAEGKYHEAETVFSALAYNPHLRGKTKEAMAKAMTAIKGKNGAEALKVFDEREAEAKKKAKMDPWDEV